MNIIWLFSPHIVLPHSRKLKRLDQLGLFNHSKPDSNWIWIKIWSDFVLGIHIIVYLASDLIIIKDQLAVTNQNPDLSFLGSLTPWLEAILLLKGASHVTSFDYNKIVSHHPQVTTLLPNELANEYFNGKRFDVMATYSSLEHSGLGRWQKWRPLSDLFFKDFIVHNSMAWATQYN